MSELGVFAVDRGVFDHPLFATGEPFSRREAWLWLVAEAAWKPRQVNRNGVIIDLQRGQLAHSIRFMAEAWGWSKSAVDRFLARLKTGTMIGTEAGTGAIVITICKYDAYQRLGLPDRDSNRDGNRDTTGTGAGQTRNIQTFKQDIMSDPQAASDHGRGSSPKKKRNVYTPEYEAFWKAYPQTVGMTKMDGFKAWQKLSPEEQTQAISSLPAYKSLLAKNPDRAVKHVQGFLNGRMFESFGDTTVTTLETPVQWSKRLAFARAKSEWSSDWGPMPGVTGCRVPANLLRPGDGHGWNTWRAAS